MQEPLPFTHGSYMGSVYGKTCFARTERQSPVMTGMLLADIETILHHLP